MRIHKFMSACLFICFVPCVPVQAQTEADAGRCSDAAVKLVGKHFHLDNFVYPVWGASENGGLIVAGVCKSWPTNNSRVVAAFAYNQGVEYDKLLVVAVIDTRTNQIISSYKSLIQEDGAMRVDEDSLRIDTARYQLTEKIRAFGIDLRSGGISNCGEGGSGADRTLYVQEGKTLRPVLTITMSHWQFVIGGNPRCMPVDQELPDTVVEDVHLTIGLDNSETNGYRDISVSATSSRDDGKPTKRGTFRYKLKYDGRQYPTQEMDNMLFEWKR